MLRVQNISVQYRDTVVLNNISFSLNAGETLAIIGPSGAGKSTLLKSLAALVPLAQGDVTLCNIAANTHGQSTLEPWDTRRKISLVSQESSLFPHYTARKNIEIGLEVCGALSAMERSQRIARIAQELELVTDTDMSLLDRYPEQLSGGQRQRIQLARTLLLRPRVLLLDEITNGLDPIATAQVLHLLTTIRKKNPALIIIIVTHFMKFIEHCVDHIYFLKDGEIRERMCLKKDAEYVYTPHIQAYMTRFSSTSFQNL